MATTQFYNDMALDFSEGGNFVLPDPGVYIIKFLGIVDKMDWPKKNQQGEYVYDEDGNQVMETSLTLQFVIDDEDDEFDAVEFRDYFPKRATTGNKSGRLWAALWGVASASELPQPLPNVAEFVGKRGQASLIHRKAANGNTYLKIDSIVPLKKRKQRVIVEDEDGEGF